MDARDIFKQLTCGASFTKSKTLIKPVIKKTHEYKVDVKLEPESSDDDDLRECIENPNETTTGDNLDNSDNEDRNNLKIFEDINAPNAIKKKKKKMTAEKLQLLETEKINQIRNKHHIIVTGKEPPPPLETFDELQNQCKISSQIITNVINCGYNSPTPIQMQTIPVMTQGRSLMACAPTGSGKTAAFLLPIIKDLKKPKTMGFRALILCPTRELAKQTQRECFRLVEDIGLQVHTLSKIGHAENRYGTKSNHKFDILITTPNRICYLLSQNPPVLDFSNVRWLILDEADKLFEEGAKSFRQQFDQIYQSCTNDKKKVALFSATWTNSVSKWCRKNIKNLLTINIGQRNSATDLVDQELLFVGSEAGKLLAFRDLLRNGVQPPVLVFVDSKDRAQQLFKELIYDGINVDVIHADRTQQQRDNVVKAFREGKIWVLISTELIGRGIDFKGVNLVVNYDFPPTAIAYIHRIGRTGRAGRKGKAITYFTQEDTVNLKSIAKVLKNSGCDVPKFMLTLKDLHKKDKIKLEKNKKPREDISTKYASIKSKNIKNNLRKAKMNASSTKSQSLGGKKRKSKSSTVIANNKKRKTNVTEDN